MPKNITLFQADTSDAPFLTQISFASKRHWQYPEEWIEKWREVLTITSDYIQKNYVHKLVKEGKIIGFCAIEKQSDHFEITHLWLLPDYIGEGLGKILLHHTIQAVIPVGAVISVVSDPNAEAFYLSQGFVRIGQVESYPPGRWLPLLERTR